MKFHILAWVRNVNRILVLKDARHINDEIKKLALVYYEKNRKKKTAINNMKQGENRQSETEGATKKNRRKCEKKPRQVRENQVRYLQRRRISKVISNQI